MAMIDQRATLARLMAERHEDFTNLSRVIGRNPSYIQQFVRRGVPKRLGENDRRALARYLRVPESELGGPPLEPALPAAEDGSGLVLVPRYDLEASAGPGSLDPEERPAAFMGFDPKWLQSVCASEADHLSIIRVRGDSMLPTLSDGDDIMVDQSQNGRRVRDGVYVLRQDDTLLVKRIAVSPASKKATISSDNAAYPSWPDCALDDLDIVGRVVWAGRRMS